MQQLYKMIIDSSKMHSIYNHSKINIYKHSFISMIYIIFRHTGYSVLNYIYRLNPLVAALHQPTKNAIHTGHFGNNGKIFHKIFLVTIFNFVEPQRKPLPCSELASEHGRGWTSPVGASARHIGICFICTTSKDIG